MDSTPVGLWGVLLETALQRVAWMAFSLQTYTIHFPRRKASLKILLSYTITTNKTRQPSKCTKDSSYFPPLCLSIEECASRQRDKEEHLEHQGTASIRWCCLATKKGQNFDFQPQRWGSREHITGLRTLRLIHPFIPSWVMKVEVLAISFPTKHSNFQLFG